jgi:glycosyltransferase involved in cell wall biosynthesis
VRILLVSQYFEPEVGATQNRLGAFAHGLVARGHEVTVVAEQPNHPAGVFAPGYGRRPLEVERARGRTVYRLWVAASPRKTTMRRLAFYGTFAAGAALSTAMLRRPDAVFVTSPPLPAALATAGVAAARRIPYVLDVRDLWPAAAEALGELSSASLIRIFERTERRLYRGAHRVTATTRPFCRHIDAVAGRPVSVHLPNGALDELVALPDAPPARNGTFTVGYAGNLGIAQGLAIVLDAAEQLRDEGIRFMLVGDGPLSAELRAEQSRRGLSAVEIRPGVPTSAIGSFLQGCDALLIPLRDHPLLRDFIPSKLYDAMAVGRPALVAAAGEACDLATELGCGLPVRPEDGADLAAQVRRLRDDPRLGARLGAAGRAAAADHARSRQVEKLERVLREAAGSH